MPPMVPCGAALSSCASVDDACLSVDTRWRRRSREEWEELQHHAVLAFLVELQGTALDRDWHERPRELDIDNALAVLQPRGYDLPPGGEVEQLGAGGFGSVFRARRCDDRQFFAVKRQPMGTMTKDAVFWLREISILSSLVGAPHIVQLQEAFMAYSIAKAPEIWMVLEHFPNNLSDVIRDRRMSEEETKHVVLQVLLGLHALHVADIVHRDVKPANTLINFCGEETQPCAWRVSICDFGLARCIADFPGAEGDTLPPGKVRRRISLKQGTRGYMAPERCGWATLDHVTKDDLKSEDAFALALMWARLLTEVHYLQWKDDEPKELRFVEMIKKLGPPTSEEMNEQGFSSEIQRLSREVSSGESGRMKRLKRDILRGVSSSVKQRYYFDLLKEMSAGSISEHICRESAVLADGSPAPALIEGVACFAARGRRKAVDRLLADVYFKELLVKRPSWHRGEGEQWVPTCCGDVRAELDSEIKEQSKWFASKGRSQRAPAPDVDAVRASVCRSLALLEKHVRLAARNRKPRQAAVICPAAARKRGALPPRPRLPPRPLLPPRPKFPPPPM